MRKFCTITPTRGDRKELLAFTMYRMPEDIEKIIVDYAPESDEVDLIPRIRKGIEIAKSKGFEYALIIEDDDYYPDEYYELAQKEFTNGDFFGFDNTLYYNLKNRTYEVLNHARRSSLFCTAFKISALDNFRWPADHFKFLDIRIWEYAFNEGYRVKLLKNNPSIGIKHGIGKCAGKGHTMKWEKEDPYLNYLRSKVDDQAFEFYKTLSEKL
jgi:hypothetical protein